MAAPLLNIVKTIDFYVIEHCFSFRISTHTVTSCTFATALYTLPLYLNPEAGGHHTKVTPPASLSDELPDESPECVGRFC